MTKTSKAKSDVYQEVTDRIIAVMEKGELPWLKPWKKSGKGDAVAQLPYNASAARITAA